MRTRHVRLDFAAITLLAVLCRAASAEPGSTPLGSTQRDDPRARQFFEVGQQAYGKSEYLLAIEAFEQAYAIVQRPGLLFSLGQAHQRQFRVKAEEAHLQAALEYYRRYLTADATGRRRAEALAAIESLTTIAQQLHPNGGEESGAIFGKLLVSSPTPGVAVSVNGDRVETLPASLELPSNTYAVNAQAPGYAAERRDVSIAVGVTVPLNFDLRPLPSGLRIHGPVGAEAFVDGRPVGFLPAPSLSLPAGEHWVSLRQPGRTTRNVRVELLRGQTTRTELELDTSSQRHAAWIVGASGALALVATGVFVGAAVARDNVASDLEARRGQGQLSSRDGDRLNAAVDGRNRFRTLAVASSVSTVALVGTALALYISDSPAPPHNQNGGTAAETSGIELRAFGGAAAWGALLSRRF